MTPYKRYPPPHRGVWILIVLLLAVLFANLIRQAGIG